MDYSYDFSLTWISFGFAIIKKSSPCETNF